MSDYIRIEDAKYALQEKVFHDLTDEFYGAMQALDELPPADVAPVVHGKWVNGSCDKCGKHAPYWLMSSTYYEGDFCPNCGAKMDGGDEHG
jgi:hypothetical protein